MLPTGEADVSLFYYFRDVRGQLGMCLSCLCDALFSAEINLCAWGCVEKSTRGGEDVHGAVSQHVAMDDAPAPFPFPPLCEERVILSWLPDLLPSLSAPWHLAKSAVKAYVCIMHAIASRDEMRHVLSRIITRPISTTKNKRFSSFFFSSFFFKGPDLQFCGECFKIVVSCCRLKSFTYCAGNLFKIDCQPLFVDAGERSWSGMACWTHVRSQHLIHCWESACSQSEGSTHLSNRFEPFFSTVVRRVAKDPNGVFAVLPAGAAFCRHYGLQVPGWTGGWPHCPQRHDCYG